MHSNQNAVIDSRDFGVVDGYRIIAEISYDPSTDPWDEFDPRSEESQTYADEWYYVELTVWTLDPATGQKLGCSCEIGFPYGLLPGGWINPLSDDDLDGGFAGGEGGEMIAEAIAAARTANAA